MGHVSLAWGAVFPMGLAGMHASPDGEHAGVGPTVGVHVVGVCV